MLGWLCLDLIIKTPEQRYLTSFKSTHLEVLYYISTLKNFVKFRILATLLKNDSIAGVSCDFYNISQKSIFLRHL